MDNTNTKIAERMEELFLFLDTDTVNEVVEIMATHKWETVDDEETRREIRKAISKAGYSTEEAEGFIYAYNIARSDMGKTENKPNNMKVMVIDTKLRIWAKADSITEAEAKLSVLANDFVAAKPNYERQVWLVSEGTEINGAGAMTTPEGENMPIRID